jgi:hypothetical protein
MRRSLQGEETSWQLETLSSLRYFWNFRYLPSITDGPSST